MNPKNQTASEREMGPHEAPAQETWDLLVYAAQEGSEQQFKDIYGGFDRERIVEVIKLKNDQLAWVDERGGEKVVRALVEDQRPEIRQALMRSGSIYGNPVLFSNSLEMNSVEDNEEERNNKRELGREAVIATAMEVGGRKLNEKELLGYRVWAQNVPDPRFIDLALFFQAPRELPIASDLAYNPGLTSEQAGQLVRIALKKRGMNQNYESIPLMLYAERRNLLDEKTQTLIERDENLGVLANPKPKPKTELKSMADAKWRKEVLRRQADSLHMEFEKRAKAKKTGEEGAKGPDMEAPGETGKEISA